MMNDDAVGNDLYGFVRELYPLCRSLTGQGVRDTLDRISRYIPLKLTSLMSGAEVFDWVIPPEWNIRDAYIKDSGGRRIVDFHSSNLHVVGYSIPVHARMSLDALRPHLHSIPERPDWIPYRTSFFRETWGFCLSHRQLESLVPGEYEVKIDATLAPGALTYGEALVPGESEEEVLIWTHVCHPSLCNDNLSAIAVAARLAETTARCPKKYSYRFVFAPATIGAVSWLKVNEQRVGLIRHGLVLTSLGDRGPFTYKQSRRGTADVDRASAYTISQSSGGATEPFSPYGYDERQFCSPGFNLPVGRLSRTANGRYPEYHTSADNLDFVTPSALSGALRACEDILFVLEHNARYLNMSSKCEPRLGSRGLFDESVACGRDEFEHSLLWVLSYSDGSHDLLEIAQRSKISFRCVVAAAEALVEAGLICQEASVCRRAHG